MHNRIGGVLVSSEKGQVLYVLRYYCNYSSTVVRCDEQLFIYQKELVVSWIIYLLVKVILQHTEH
jgi:hypothetical protein